jgi:hypothetical protein
MPLGCNGIVIVRNELVFLDETGRDLIVQDDP